MPQDVKFEFESKETNPEASPGKACVLVTLPNGAQFDVEIRVEEEKVVVEIFDYLGTNSMAMTMAHIEDIGKLGYDDTKQI